MGLASVIRQGVKVADQVTSDLQVEVSHYVWVSNDEYGNSTFDHAGPVLRKCLFELKRKLVKAPSGQMLYTRCSLTFIYPIEAHGASGRQEPIDPRDMFVLADGTTGPVLDILGFLDSGTDSPYLHQVWLG